MVGSELQELETQRTDGGARSVLGEHQVLLIKDFMLKEKGVRFISPRWIWAGRVV